MTTAREVLGRADRFRLKAAAAQKVRNAIVGAGVGGTPPEWTLRRDSYIDYAGHPEIGVEVPKCLLDVIRDAMQVEIDRNLHEAQVLEETVKVVRLCWCGGAVGVREPGDDEGLGCLEDIAHNWAGPLAYRSGVDDGPVRHRGET